MHKKNLFLIILFITTILCSCVKKECLYSSDSPYTDVNFPINLRVITEQSVADGMNYQLHTLVEQFQYNNPNVTISIDILPTNKDERASYIDQIHSEIDTGSGPDIFLLPTSDIIISDTPMQYSYFRIEPLIQNVELAMRKHQFADISCYYNADKSLNKSELLKDIMDAGVIGRRRYVLPLRFDIPIVYVFGNATKNLNCNKKITHFTIDDWMDLAIKENDSVLASGVEYISINAFSDLINYNTSKVQLTAEQVESYFTKYQKLETLILSKHTHRETVQLSNVSTLAKQFPIKIDPLSSSLAYCAFAISEGQELSMYPLRSTDGDVIATVSYYGAISSNCKNIEIAYSFLRQFLTENYQWEVNRPKPATSQYEGLVEDSWPVRVGGSIIPLWNNLKEQLQSHTTLTNVDPYGIDKILHEILHCKIDIVRFPFPNNFRNLVDTLNDFKNNNLATAVNKEELSKTLIDSLEKSILK